MKKRIITLLLAVTLTITGIHAEAVFAEAVSGENVLEAAVATPEDIAGVSGEAADSLGGITESPEAVERPEGTAEYPEAAAELADGIRMGGLQQPQCYEVEYGTMSDEYEEKIDSLGKGSAVYRNSWDQYSTNFYYNQLPEAYQQFWDKLDEMCAGYLTGTKTFTAQRDAYGNLVYATEAVTYSGMSSLTAKSLTLMFKYSNPQYYFLNTSLYWSEYSMNTGRIMMALFPAFADGAARARETAKMKAVIDSWMAQIKAQPGDLAKEKLAHDLICKAMIYDPGYSDKYIPMNEYNQVAYSVFCTKSTVCAGYSQAMQLLMNGAGIDCAVVTSKDHEWNIIRLNGTWYYVDITWNDNIADSSGLDSTYQYFNKSSASFSADNPRLVESHTPEALWDGYLPALTQDTASTKTTVGDIYVPTAAMGAPVISFSGSTATISSPSGGTIYYTLDGTNPSIASTRARKYTGAVALKKVTKIRAIATGNKFYDSPTAELTVTPRYTVSFSANGGYIGSKSTKKTTKTVTYGVKVGKLASPKRKGYAFLGWYTKKSGGKEISASTAVTGTTTYYAHWAKIKKAKASLSSVKNKSSKAMTVAIKKVSTASGYQIRYSMKKNMASAKKKLVTDNKCTIKKLKKGKTYYVQVRMYQKESVSGKKTYGPWSKTKTVKIRK
ncbi:MAG: hypothetical protein HFJ04_01570 [Lachnospiraceae bacterium]|nr:hypothetical protein [Lachnospiraceae bacterium]